MQATPAGIWWDQHALAETCDPTAKSRRTTPIKTPLPVSIDLNKLMEDSPSLDERDHALYRSILGSVGFLMHTRIDLLFAITILSQQAHKPSHAALKLLRQVAQYAKQTSSRGIFLPAHNVAATCTLKNDRRWAVTTTDIPPSSPLSENASKTNEEYHLDLITDASFKEKSVSGWIILFNGTPVTFRSYTQRRVCNSSTGAEVQALYDGMDALAAITFLLKEMGIDKVSTAVWVDSNNLVSSAHKVNPTLTELSTHLMMRQIQDMCVHPLSPTTHPDVEGLDAPLDPSVVYSSPEGPVASRWYTHTDKEKKSPGPLAGVNSFIIDLHARLYHLSGKVNPADPLTKPMKVENLLGTLLHSYEDFLAASQAIDPEVKSMLIDTKPVTVNITTNDEAPKKNPSVSSKLSSSISDSDDEALHGSVVSMFTCTDINPHPPTSVSSKNTSNIYPDQSLPRLINPTDELWTATTSTPVTSQPPIDIPSDAHPANLFGYSKIMRFALDIINPFKTKTPTLP